MSIDLLCVAATSGLPLFTRRADLRFIKNDNGLSKKIPDRDMDGEDGPNELISINTITTLYGINLFSRMNECELQTTGNGRTRIHWKVFNENLIIIVIITDIDSIIDDREVNCLLNMTYNSLVMMCGSAHMTDTNLERLKRRIKISFPLIDYILNCFTSNGIDRLEMVSKCSNYAIACRTSYISSLPNSITQMASNNYCAIFVHGKLLSASKDWWSQLSIKCNDSLLIACLLKSTYMNDLIQSKEIAIYLPDTSPTKMSRLVFSPITKGVILCMVCNEHGPSLEYIDDQILVPLNDLKLQEDKFSKYIFELRETKHISNDTFVNILGKHNVPLIKTLLGFIIFNRYQQIYFVFNEQLIEDYSNEICTFCRLNRSNVSTITNAHLSLEQVNMYRAVGNRSIIYCLLFEPSQSLKQLHVNTMTLVEAFTKAKHFWPN